jgi:hypothetical protein
MTSRTDRIDRDDTASRHVVALFQDRASAERAIRQLRDAGFGKDQIGVIMQRREDEENHSDFPLSSDPEVKDTMKGAGTGAALGGLVGLLGSLLVPGLGPLVVGGVLASTLIGAGVGAAAGGLIGMLVGMGATREEAEHFDRGVRAGGVIVTVDAGARAEEARAILQAAGADFGPGTQQPRTTAATASDARDDEPEIVIVREEVVVELPIESDATGDITMGDEAEPWRGSERRYRHDASYKGPERRRVARV